MERMDVRSWCCSKDYKPPLNLPVRKIPLVKFFYFSLAFLLNSDGFTELGFFQTPARDRPRLSSAQCQIEVEGIIKESSSERSL
jgi:hypothetical protein